MKTLDALKTLNIDCNDITKEIVKNFYKKASKKYHPDVNPSGLKMMQLINEAYEALMNESFPIFNTSEDDFQNYSEELSNALNKIITLASLSIEICGAWAWVSGDTKTHKEILKEAGFKWSNPKKMWYFRPDSQSKKFYRGKASIQDIRSKYGSSRYSSKPSFVLGY
jgi:curved DNA-binding protein CbpA